jgi:hypothetical protein
MATRCDAIMSDELGVQGASPCICKSCASFTVALYSVTSVIAKVVHYSTRAWFRRGTGSSRRDPYIQHTAMIPPCALFISLHGMLGSGRLDLVRFPHIAPTFRSSNTLYLPLSGQEPGSWGFFSLCKLLVQQMHMARRGAITIECAWLWLGHTLQGLSLHGGSLFQYSVSSL